MDSNHKITGDGFHWLDIVNPNPADLEAIAKTYSLPPHSVQDCLDSEHLPKYEKLNGAHFLILRSFDEQSTPQADTVQELTRKIAIFLSDSFLITVHRRDQPFLAALRDEVTEQEKFELTRTHFEQFFIRIIREVIHSYDRPIDRALLELEKFEMSVFDAEGAQPANIQQGYYIKRRASVFKRVAKLTTDVLERVNATALCHNASMAQDLEESLESMYFYAEELFEGTNVLMNLHVSLSSQKTNEIMRTLTFFSLLFMPMNLIAGIYGMNFKFMPELDWQHGYPVALTLMFFAAFSFYIWFRSKGWLK